MGWSVFFRQTYLSHFYNLFVVSSVWASSTLVWFMVTINNVYISFNFYSCDHDPQQSSLVEDVLVPKVVQCSVGFYSGTPGIPNTQEESCPVISNISHKYVSFAWFAVTALNFSSIVGAGSAGLQANTCLNKSRLLCSVTDRGCLSLDNFFILKYLHACIHALHLVRNQIVFFVIKITMYMLLYSCFPS